VRLGALMPFAEAIGRVTRCGIEGIASEIVGSDYVEITASPLDVGGDGGRPVSFGEEDFAQDSYVSKEERRAMTLRGIRRAGGIANQRDVVAGDAAGSGVAVREESDQSSLGDGIEVAQGMNGSGLPFRAAPASAVRQDPS
jgi:hypothetical protein